MSEVKEIKSQLAKLLATENLTVEHANVETASFDVKNRVLLCPTYNDMTNDQHDLFIGHEVAHALWTPSEGYKDYQDKPQGFHSFVNVVEDARIERLIQKKYPGLKRAFFTGYRELNQKDFFGLENVDIEALAFIDKLNLKAKLGTNVDIEFDGVEQEFYDRAMTTVTWEDVLTLTEEIYEYCKEKQEEQQQIQNPHTQPDDANQDDTQNEQMSTPMPTQANEDAPESEQTETQQSDTAEEETADTAQSEKTEDANETTDGDTEETAEGEGDDQGTQGDGLEGTEGGADELKSITDSNAERFLSDMAETDVSNVPLSVYVPNLDVANYVVPYQKYYSELYDYWNVRSSERKMRKIRETGKQFRDDNQKVINYLHKEFEMKKAAQQNARASTSRTGVIDTNKIYSYKFNDDVFKKVTSLPNGKNHGMTFLLDWSGSMADNMKGTIDQLLNLVLFCRKANVPFEVYAFSNQFPENPHTQSVSLGDAVIDSNTRLIELFSDRMNKREFDSAIDAMTVVSSMFDRGNEFGYWGLPRSFYLGGTPLDEALVLAIPMIRKFQSRTGAEILNMIVLSDGASHRMEVFQPNKYGNVSAEGIYGRSVLHLTDRKSGTKIEVSNKTGRRVDMTGGLLELLKKSVKCNLVGFFISSPRDFRYAYSHYMRGDMFEYETVRKEWMREKTAVATDCGYDELYIIKGGKSLAVKDEGLNVDSGASKAKLTSAFKKMQKGKLANRVVLTKFVEKISKSA